MSAPIPTKPSGSAEDPCIVVGDDGLARPAWANVDPMLRDYYDTEWGMPIRDGQGMYERLGLEAFQAGLSWATILRKRPAFRAAFVDFDPERVARDGEPEIERLMADRGIVRNRATIHAAIPNANATITMRERAAWPHSSGRSNLQRRRPRAPSPRPHDDVRADGRDRDHRHPPHRLAPPRLLRHLARMTAVSRIRIDANGPFDHNAALGTLAVHAADGLHRLHPDSAELTRWVDVHGDPTRLRSASIRLVRPCRQNFVQSPGCSKS